MGTGVGERLPWVTLHSWPSASKSRLHLMGNIDIQTDEIRATAVVGLFFCESLSRKQRVPTDHRKASSMPRSGLLGLVAGLRGSKAAMPPRRLHYSTVLF